MPAGVETDVLWPADAVEVGRIVDAFGVKGWLKVQPYAGQPEALVGARRWYVQPALRQGAAQAPSPSAPPAYSGVLRVLELRDHSDLLVAHLDGVADRSAAEALKGARLFVSRASFPTPQDGEYYWVDLIGLDVVNRQDEALGQVSEVFDTGAHSVLRVLSAAPVASHDDTAHTVSDIDASPRERLIPFVAAYIDQVDLAARCIRVDWLPDYD